MDIPKNENTKIIRQMITAMLIFNERGKAMFFILFYLHSSVKFRVQIKKEKTALLSSPQLAHGPEHLVDIHRLRQMLIHTCILCQCDVFLKCVR